jgi:hypothetical protein
MHQFKISPAGVAQVKRKAMRTTVPVMIAAVLVGGLLPELGGRGRDQFNPNTLLVVVPLMAGILGFGFWKGFKRQKQLLESYTLTVEADEVIREQLDTPTVRIPKKDIASIVRNANGSLSIKGSNRAGEIIVPVQMNEQAELERLLEEIRPVTVPSSVPFLQRYNMLLGWVTVGLMALHFIAASAAAVVASGVVIIGLTLWSFITIVRNKNVDNKTARGAYWSLFVVLAVLVRIFFTIS